MSIHFGLRRCLTGGLSVLALSLVCARPLAAQEIPDSDVYAAKFTCGFVPGTLPTSTDPTPPAAQVVYRDVQPGAYSTVFNIVNLLKATGGTTTPFNLSIHVAGLGTTSYTFATLFNLPFGDNVGAPVSHTLKYGCPDITQRLTQSFPSFVAGGAYVEGYLEIAANNEPTRPALLDVSVTHTYTERNATAGVGSSIQIEHLTSQRRCCFFNQPD